MKRMRKSQLADVKPGAVLARSIYDDRGGRLLAAGAELTPRVIASLMNREISAVLINDKLSDDIVLQEAVSEQIRQKATGRLRATFGALSEAYSDVKGQSVEDVRHEIRRGQPGSKGPGHSSYKEISQLVDEIIKDISGSVTLSGLAELSSHDDSALSQSVDMAAIAVRLGILADVEPKGLRQLAEGSLFHDLGKVFVDESVLNKRGPLNDEEFAIMHQHPLLGYEMMRKEAWGDALTRHVVYQHHERQDGLGYPRRLTGLNRVKRSVRELFDGRNIVLVAEIAALADVYCALGSRRPYRAALPHDAIMDHLAAMSGTQLNKEVVDLFLRNVPRYPPGTEVRLSSTQMAGFKALVVNSPTDALDRPTIRVFEDSDGGNVVPFDIDLRSAPTVKVMSIAS